MTAIEGISLALAAMAGGAVNAVAGGGTLITFPALLLFGTPPVIANATSTLALVLGTSGSIFGYRRHMDAVKPWLWRFIPVSLLGGLAGAALLTVTSEETFSKFVPFLILFATVIFLLQGVVQRSADPARTTDHPHSQKAIWGAIVFQFFVATYGGYFGAGIGILMLAALGFIGLRNIHEMNTLKTILGSLINVVAAVWFVAAGLIHWPKAGIMTVGAIAGYYLGAHFAQRISQARVRQLVTFIGFSLGAWTFYEEFLKRH